MDSIGKYNFEVHFEMKRKFTIAIEETVTEEFEVYARRLEKQKKIIKKANLCSNREMFNAEKSQYSIRRIMTKLNGSSFKN